MIEYQGKKFKEYLKSRIEKDKTKPKAERLSMQKAIDMLGISKTNMYQYFESKSLKRETVHKILTVFDATAEEIFGEDPDRVLAVREAIPVYNHLKTQSANEPYIDLKNGQFLLITPLIDEYAQGDYISNFDKPEYMNQLPKHSIIVSRLTDGNHVSFVVTEPSMDDNTKDSIPEGSIVTGLEIENDLWKTKFHIKTMKDYVIVSEEGIVIRRIIGHDPESEVVVCRALHPDKATYPDVELMLGSIKQLFRIVNKTLFC